MSALFGTTLREAPSGASAAGAAFLARAGFLRDQGSGRAVFLPLGARTLARIERRMLRELESVGALEVVLPAGADAARSIASLVRTEVRSWRQLPRTLVARSASGAEPGSVHVFLMDAEDRSLGLRLDGMAGSFRRAFSACGLTAQEAEGSGDGLAFVVPSGAGETDLARCEACGYTALRDAARFAGGAPAAEELLPLRKVATPGCATIDELARFLHIGPEKTAKAVLLVADEARFIFAVVRGDREVSDARLRDAVEALTLRPATEEEIRAAGAVPGYASPIGLPSSTLVVADPEVPASANLAAGANEEGFHLLNTNVPRDYTPTLVRGIAAMPPRALCVKCGKPLSVGQAFDLGSFRRIAFRPWEKEPPTYQDAEGKERAVCMAKLRYLSDRILAAAAESNRDEQGLRWPAAIAPFDAHVLTLGGRGTDAAKEAERLCGELSAHGLEVLLDDRDESPGVKFADADLIGIPLRITVSARSLAAGGVEVKLRDSPRKAVMERGRAVAEARALVAAL